MNRDDLLQLQQPLKEGGVRSVNFFNGRLLTSKDLSREQEARRDLDARLGLALGEGVAYGLEARRDEQRDRPEQPVLRIEPGLAINRAGQVLRLASATSVALARSVSGSTSTGVCDCAFASCSPVDAGLYVAAAGVYVLTLAPAAVGDGRAPSNGLDPLNVRCNTDSTIEALQFRLLPFTPTLLAGLDLASSTLRNALAYRCFGNGVQPSGLAPLLDGMPRADDALEALRKLTLSPAEVPLALVYFERSAQLGFVDNWAVRRPLHHAESSLLAGLCETRRQSVGRAMFLQFQAQVAELAAPRVLPPTVTAQSHFRYLPPVGVIPVAFENASSDAAALRFFTGMTCRKPAFINAARLEDLVRESLGYPPIDTHSGECVWLYRVRENHVAAAPGSAASAPRASLVFASGHLPYRADAQFDLAHWSQANFALAR